MVSEGVKGRLKFHKAQKNEKVDMILVKLSHFHERIDLQYCLRCVTYDFSTFSLLHFDVFGESNTKP